MIKIFSPTDKTFYSNGNVILQSLKTKIYKEDNSDYYKEDLLWFLIRSIWPRKVLKCSISVLSMK